MKTIFTQLKPSIPSGSRLFNKTMSFKYVAFLVFQCLYSTSTFSQFAPVFPPTGGFAIDGDLRANTPVSPSPFAINQGDWFFGAGGTGGFVFNEGPLAIDPTRTGRAMDPYNNNDNVFTNGSKFNDYIGDLRWFTNSAPDKNDINNALYHFARNQANNHQWIFISGDRLSTNGTSYIDFELLQGNVTENGNGTFTGTPAAGKPNGGGRTENDMVISMEYTNGGTKPNVYIYQWKESNGKWSFQQITPSADLAANAFAETNRSGAIASIPYEAFGSASYLQYAFVEAGINISYLLSLTNLACQGLNVQTLWVKTKASASSTAALKDYIKPIPVNFEFGSASIDPISAKCVSDNMPYELKATPSGGTFSGGTGVSGPDADGKYYFTPSTAGVGEHSINYQFSGCSASTKIKVNALPTITPGSYGPYCIDAAAVTLVGSPTGGTWTGNGVSLVAGVYKFTPSSVSAGSHALTYSYTDANTSCSNSATTNVTVNALPATPMVSVTPPTCANANGTVTVTSPTGGDYEYSNNGGAYQSSASFTVASGASYSIVAKNKTTQCVSLAKTGTMASQPATPSFTVCIVQPSLCATGSLTINATGGSGFSYSIDGIDFTNNTGVFSNLGAASVTNVQVKNSDGCSSPSVPCANLVSQCQTVKTAAKSAPATNIVEPKEVTVKAFPNPFKDNIRFIVTAPQAGKGSLDIYNATGQKIRNVYTGKINAGTQTFELNMPAKQAANMIYMLRIGDKKVSGIVMQVNR